MSRNRASNPESLLVPVRPRHLAAGFGAYLVVVLWLARSTSMATTGPWFPATDSFWAYAMNFLGALVLAVGLALTGASAGRRKGSATGNLDPKTLREGLASVQSKLVALRVHRRGEVTEEEVAPLIQSLHDETDEAGVVDGALAELAGLLVPLSDAESSNPDGTPEVDRRLAALGAVAGPVAVCAGLAAVSGALLPASAGFLQTNFQFNTMVILTLAYGWIGLLVYTLGSAFLVLRAR